MFLHEDVHSRPVVRIGEVASVQMSDGALHHAAERGDVAKIEQLLTGLNMHGAMLAGRDIGEKDSHGQIPLHLAVAFGHAEAVWLLLVKGSDPETRTRDGGVNGYGRTALDLAKQYNQPKIVAMLENPSAYKAKMAEMQQFENELRLRNEGSVASPSTSAMANLSVDSCDSKADELAGFLAGLELSSLLPKLQENDVRTVADLKLLGEDDFKELGFSVGARRKIPSALKDL